MSYKIVKNAAGDLVCYGPNDNNYEPTIPAGCTLSISDIIPPTPLAQTQATANSAIDAQSGATRLKYITDVAGQSETYLAKSSDATAYKAALYPVASIASYPMVQAEAKALYGATPTAAQFQAAADGIIATQAQWLQLAAAIEQARRAGKIAVNAATTNAGAQAAQQAAITALQAL